MAKRLVATAPHVLAVDAYEPPTVGPAQVRVRSEYASGKHGTAVAIFDNVNFEGQNFDLEMRLFRAAPGAHGPGPAAAAGSSTRASEETVPPAPYAKPQPQGTTAVGVVEEVGSDVTGLRVGDRVVGLIDLGGLTDPLVGLDEMPETWRRIESDPGSVINYGVRFA